MSCFRHVIYAIHDVLVVFRSSPVRTPLLSDLLSSAKTWGFVILDGMGCLLSFVSTSGLSAGAAAAALDLEAGPT